MTDQEILFEVRDARAGKVAFVTLNRPAALNAVTLEMISALDAQLIEWALDADITLVVLRGSGERAFCAGGDVRHLYESMLECDLGPNEYATEFFSREYRLDYRIHTYPKPVLCFGTGIVMGGGMGLFTGASHRLVTETSRMAMPEITIGLFPDVGATWFLNRMPAGVGLFLGLTGAMMNASDALMLGLADHFLPAGLWDELETSLLDFEWKMDQSEDAAALTELIDKAAAKGDVQAPESNIGAHQAWITDVTSGGELSEIVDRIIAVENSEDRWLAKAAAGLAGGSPTTAHLVSRQLARGTDLGLADVFRLELGMAIQCTRHPDFAEGVRALLIDKDNRPAWKYTSVSDVPEHWVAEHFTAPWPPEQDPLKDLA